MVFMYMVLYVLDQFFTIHARMIFFETFREYMRHESLVLYIICLVRVHVQVYDSNGLYYIHFQQ